VVVELTASCDLAGAVELTSEQQTAQRYLRVERNAEKVSITRADTFPGGCVTQRLVAPRRAGSSWPARQRSGGRLTLDGGRQMRTQARGRSSMAGLLRSSVIER
jgi:hypothetical protein